MAENTDTTESPYVPGVYAKGDDERVANSARDAVALVFEGYKLKEGATAVESEEPVTEATPKPVEPPKPTPPKPTEKPKDNA